MTQGRYAEGTSVPISRSREELERTLERFGATAQAWMRDDEIGNITLAFKRKGNGYKFSISLRTQEDERYTPTRLRRSDSVARDAADKENRRRFRSLANYVKALMDAADTGIIEAEEALMPYMILPTGQTVAEALTAALPALEAGHFDMRLALTGGQGSER